MLSGEHAIVRYENGRAIPDRLTRRRHAHYVEHARRMLAVYASGIGSTRRELHLSVQNLLASEPDCDTRRIASFCRLLDDAGEFDIDRRGKAAALRLRVFSMAAPYQPLVTTADAIFDHQQSDVKARIARELGRPWREIEQDLYADVIDFQRLKSFTGYRSPEALLARCNVAQLQACLYRARHMTVWAAADFKTILRYAKLARLLHEIRRLGPDRYRIDLSGPASVVMETRRYGVDFARFAAALLTCRDWTMRAEVQTPWGTGAVLECSSAEGLASHLPPPGDFDSSVEESFARRFGPERDGWRLIREGAILHDGQTTFVPDFVFRHADGREVFMEIVGFWTPQYLEKKRQTIRRFAVSQRIVLAVARRILRGAGRLPADVIVYRTALKIEPVLAALNAVEPAGTAAR